MLLRYEKPHDLGSVYRFTDWCVCFHSESMGISADSSSRAFPSADIEAFFKRIITGIPQDIYGGTEYNTDHFVVAVDPSGGGSSQFAVFSICQLSNGTIMVCAASFPASHLPTSRTTAC